MHGFLKTGPTSFLLAVAMVSLASCGPARRAEMSAMDDNSLTESMKEVRTERICSAIGSGWGDERYQKFARAEAERQNLGDCSEAHKLCIEVGFVYKSQEYADCRIKLAQGGYGPSGGNSNSTTKAMGNALGDWGKKTQDGAYQQPASAVKNCTSTRVGGTIQTTCY